MNPRDSNTGFRRVICDVVDLCELQVQLLSVDAQVARRSATRGMALIGITAMTTASMLTVLMIACGYVLHEKANWSVGISMLAVCGIVLLVSSLLAYFALQCLKSASSALNETKSEFAENLRWLKATILSPDTSTGNQARSMTVPDFETMLPNGRIAPDVNVKQPHHSFQR